MKTMSRSDFKCLTGKDPRKIMSHYFLWTLRHTIWVLNDLKVMSQRQFPEGNVFLSLPLCWGMKTSMGNGDEGKEGGGAGLAHVGEGMRRNGGTGGVQEPAC